MRGELHWCANVLAILVYVQAFLFNAQTQAYSSTTIPPMPTLSPTFTAYSSSSILSTPTPTPLFTRTPDCVTYYYPSLVYVSYPASPRPEILNSRKDCENLCTDNPLCVSYQIDSKPEAVAFCWLQVTLNATALRIWDNLFPQANVVEYIKNKYCSQGSTPAPPAATGITGCQGVYNITYPGLVSRSATPQEGIVSRTACQDLCTDTLWCLSYQLDRRTNAEAYCWLQFDANSLFNVSDFESVQTVIEYIKAPTCDKLGQSTPNTRPLPDTDCSWILYYNSNSSGGTLQNNIISFARCNDSCVAIWYCIAFEWVSNASLGNQCFFFRSNSPPEKLGKAPGTNHYVWTCGTATPTPTPTPGSPTISWLRVSETTRITPSPAPTPYHVATAPRFSSTSYSTTSRSGPDYCASNPCFNGGTCSNNLTSFQCVCASGYTSQQCESEINNCETYPCEPFGQCMSFLNGYYCMCKPGFQYVNDTFCSDIHQCSTSNPCYNDGTCKEEFNRFKCQCPYGKVGYRCELDATYFIYPTITGVSQRYGLLSGGEKLILSWNNISDIPVYGVYFRSIRNNSQFLFGYVDTTMSNSTSIVITTPRAPSTDYVGNQFNISVEFTGPIEVPTPFTFAYVHNPIFVDVQPRDPFLIAGLRMTVTGNNFVVSSQYRMILEVAYMYLPDISWGNRDHNVASQSCSFESETQLICLLPLITLPTEFCCNNALSVFRKRRHEPDWFGSSDDSIEGQKRFRRETPMDGSCSSSDMSFVIKFVSNNIKSFSQFRVCPQYRPNFHFFVEDAVREYDPSSGESLKIKGNQLGSGYSRLDITVNIGQSVCAVSDSSDNLLQCLPPSTPPTSGNETDVFNCKDNLVVTIQIAKGDTYFVFCLRYSSIGNVGVIVGLCVGFSFIPLLVWIGVMIWQSRQAATSTKAERFTPPESGASSKKVQPRNGTTRVEERQHHQDDVGNNNEDSTVEDRYKASRGSMFPPQPPYRNYDKKSNGMSSNNDRYLNNDEYGEDEDPEEQRGDNYLNNEEYAARGYPALNSNEQKFANPCFNGYDIRNTYLRNNQSYINDDDNA